MPDRATQVTRPTESAAGTPAPTDRDDLARRGLQLLAVAGLVLPWFHYLPYFAEGGLAAVHGFWGAATTNAVSTAITLDVYTAAAAFALWVLRERRVRRPWLWVLACFALGLAAALPWYLVQRDAAGSNRGGGLSH